LSEKELRLAADPVREQLVELEDRASKIAKRLTADQAPVVVEFAGSPKSGKTTTIDIAEHFFKRTGFKVWAPSEGASKRTPYHLRRDLVAYNSWTLNYAISELLVTYHNVDRPHIIFLDRGPFDSIAWMSLLAERGELSEQEFSTIRAFALHPKWSRLISRLYLFTCDPEVSLQREHASKLTTKSGTAMNEDLLTRLLDHYESLKSQLEGYPVTSIQTSNDTTPLATSFKIVQDVLGMIEAVS
jgi:thymidylate kinase